MLAKLSSMSTMSAASRATSDALSPPMATPMSAARRAGLSFTPSPVTATTWPTRRQCSTMSSFCCGDVRANTSSWWRMMASHSSLVLRWASSSPVTTRAWMAGSSSGTSSSSTPRDSAMSRRVGRVRMATRRAMASAVSAWSPVTMNTEMPASRHVSMACSTPSLGGSMSETRPRKMNPPELTSSKASWSATSRTGSVRRAKPITRCPCDANRS
mmetsp:Transcript_20064/g.63984  ORF Transcript_20064/g.63984 Transcript_20064/m.63984 type:complete len:214 (-) Transcript_20064:904-1545(-)